MNKYMGTLPLLAGTLFLSTCIFAADIDKKSINGSTSILLKNQNNENNQWNGIGQIFWGEDPNCTASLLDTRDNNNNAVGPAYLLTAGNCIVGVPHLRQPQPVPKTVKFNYFSDTTNSYKSYTIRTTIWENREQTDLAIIELNSSLATLLEDGITPLKLALQSPTTSHDTLVFSTRKAQQEVGLRVRACLQEPAGSPVISGDNIYLNALKNRCGEDDLDSWGAPMLDRKSGNILGVLSMDTSRSTIDRQCFDYAPCEVKNGQPIGSPNTQYGHPVDFLSSCFSKGVFTNTSNACTLERSFQITDLENDSRYIAMPSAAKQPHAQARFSLSTSYFRFKTARDVMQCSLPDSYSDISSATDAAIKTAITREPGIYFLCIIGVESAEQMLTAELMKNTLILPTQLVERAPVGLPLEPDYVIHADKTLGLQFGQRLPSNFAIYYYKGPFKNTDCNSVDRKEYSYTAHEVPIKPEEFPFTLCSRNVDMSQRASKEALTFHFNEVGRMSR